MGEKENGLYDSDKHNQSGSCFHALLDSAGLRSCAFDRQQLDPRRAFATLDRVRELAFRRGPTRADQIMQQFSDTKPCQHDAG